MAHCSAKKAPSPSLPSLLPNAGAEQAATGGSDVRNARTLRGAVLCPLEGGDNYQQSTDQDPPANLCSLSFQQQEPSRKACHHTQMTHTVLVSSVSTCTMCMYLCSAIKSSFVLMMIKAFQFLRPSHHLVLLVLFLIA